MKVRVYWNIQKKIWSVQQNGKVIKHLPAMIVDNAKFTVQPGGRARVLREKQKCVHAFVDGELTVEGDTVDAILGIFGTLPQDSESVTYNPYKHATFVKRKDESPIESAPRVILTSVYLPDIGRKPDVVVCNPALAPV